MKPDKLLVLLVTAGLLLASIPGAAVVGASADQGVVQTQVEDDATESPTENGTEDETGTDSTAESTNDSESDSENGSQASTGQQLATVIAVTDDEVNGDVSSASLEAALEDANESERAAILAERAAALRERADEVAAERENATAAFDAGDLSRTEYAQRLAVLASRANTIDNSLERLDDHAEDVSALELRAAGYDRSANQDARERLGRLTSAGASALLAQYTGESSGEFELETENGLSIEVESEDGEHSRELERPQPGNGSFVVNVSEAQDAARGALADPGDAEGEWTLRSMERDDDGYYEFGFAFVGANATGEAEVSVDGETGEVFELEEEIEPREADDEDDEDEEDGDADDERDDDTDDRPLSVSLVDGTPEAGAEVTLRVTADGEPVEGAAVEFDDQSVGSTDADGLLTVTLPDDDEVDVEVEAGEREGELELSLREVSDEERENAEISERLSVDGTLDNGTATLRVTYDGEGVANATAYVDGDRVGATDEDGSLFFETSATDELEVALVKGSFEAELEFAVGDDGTLVADDVDLEERDDEDERDEDERAEDDDREEDDAEEGSESDGDDDRDDDDDEEEEDDDEDDDDDEEDDEADEEDDE